MKWKFRKNEAVEEIEMIELLTRYINTSLDITKMSIEKAIDMYAKIIAKSEFKEYRMKDGKVVPFKDDLYYLLNIKTNHNEYATDFFRRVVRRMLRYGECLIIPIKDKLYIADNFIKNDVILKETIFSDICIGNLKLNFKFSSSNVIYLQNRNKKLMRYLNAFSETYCSLHSTICENYKVSNTKKFRVSLPTQVSVKITENGETLTKAQYISKLEEQLKSKNISIIPIGNGTSLDEIAKQAMSFNDLEEMERNIKETVAFIFDIPVDIFIGKTTEKSNAMNDFITFGIEPIIEIINDGLNAYFFDKKELLRGEMVEINKTTLKHIDILDVAIQLDKLYTDGFSHNELREFVGIHLLDEPFADERHITKNYENMKEVDVNNEH